MFSFILLILRICFNQHKITIILRTGIVHNIDFLLAICDSDIFSCNLQDALLQDVPTATTKLQYFSI